MIRGAALIGLLLFFFSCSESSGPAGIIEPKEMKLVIWDILRADVLAEEIARKDSTTNKDKESIRLSDTVFRLHNITRSQFENSLAYYSKNPGMMKVVLDSLNALQIRKPIITDSTSKKAQ